MCVVIVGTGVAVDCWCKYCALLLLLSATDGYCCYCCRVLLLLLFVDAGAACC